MTSTATSAGKTLDLDQITKLLSETRTRGDYDVILDNFHASGEAGIEVELGAGQLAGKGAQNVYTGLVNAKKKQDADGKLVREWGPAIKVIKKNFGTKDNPDEHVFLINTALVEGQSAEDETDDES